MKAKERVDAICRSGDAIAFEEELGHFPTREIRIANTFSQNNWMRNRAISVDPQMPERVVKDLLLSVPLSNNAMVVRGSTISPVNISNSPESPPQQMVVGNVFADSKCGCSLLLLEPGLCNKIVESYPRLLLASPASSAKSRSIVDNNRGATATKGPVVMARVPQPWNVLERVGRHYHIANQIMY